MSLDNEQFAFYKKIVLYCRKHNTDTIPLNKFNDKQRSIAQRLVDSHVLDRRNNTYILRTEVL